MKWITTKGENVGYATKCNFTEIFKTIYTNAERLSTPVIKSEMKIVMEKSKPFICSLR